MKLVQSAQTFTMNSDFKDDINDYCDDDDTDEKCNDDCDDKPDWADSTIEYENEQSDGGSYLMMRISSFYLSTVQPKLEDFLQKNVLDFHLDVDSSNLSSHSLRQYDIFQSYVQLFETLMDCVSSEYSTNELIDALKEAQLSSAAGKESMGTIMLDLLSAVSSFEDFELMMSEEFLLHSSNSRKYEEANNSKSCK